MAKQGAKTAVPRLRFPEFQDAGEWTIGELEGVANFVNEKISVSTLSTCDYISTENLLPDYGETVVSTKLPDVASVTRYKCGDVLISNIRPYLKKVWRADKDGGASNDVIVVRAKTSLSEAFLSLVLRNDAFIAYVMESAKGVKMPRGDVGAMRQYPLAYPTPSEQQKIADCLTSLDEVIAAQGRKVEALKTHKRGLMQQLFPREGETRPPLRFPEFRDAPEWEQHRLGDIASISKGKGISKADIAVEGRTPCIRYGELYTVYGEVIDRPLSRTDVPAAELVLSQAGDVLVPASGETKEDIATSAVVLGAGVALGGDLNIIRLDADGRFFSYYLNGAKRRALAKVAQGDTVVHLYPRQLEQLDVAIPVDKAEQQRIADCLTSLDTQITAESAQLAALKTHKQGLMQQLFPSLEGMVA